MWLSGASFGMLFIAYLGWAADVLLGPIAFLTSIVAAVQALWTRADRFFTFGALLIAAPAFAWAVYALTGHSAS